MKTNKDLSYFRLKLKKYLNDYHPDKIENKEFINSRASQALNVYTNSISKGNNHIEAEELATQTLFSGLHFSSYDLLVNIMENEFMEFFKDVSPSKELVINLIKHPQIQQTFSKYEITDSFEDSIEYNKLYTELTGVIVILIEDNQLLLE